MNNQLLVLQAGVVKRAPPGLCYFQFYSLLFADNETTLAIEAGGETSAAETNF